MKMKENKIVKVALDIGNHSIKLLIGEMDSECTKMSVIDYVKVRSKGIKKSVIEDSEALYESLKEAIQKLAEKTDYTIDKLSIGIGGASISSRTKNVGITFEEKEIEKEDVENLQKN